MEWMDPLTANLLDLLFELREHPIPLTIGGGFGLYLKRMRLEQTRERTLFSQLPMPRATNDLDLFLRADVLCDLESMKIVAATLDRLGRNDFAEPTSIGAIRLREHPLFRPEFPIPDFLAVLSEIFQA